MKRRTFLKSSLAAGSLAGVAQMNNLATGADMKSTSEFYELRVYSLKDAVQQKPVEDYLGSALVPAYNRQGVKTVGVFSEIPLPNTAPPPPALYTLAIYQSLDQFATVSAKLFADSEFQKAGAAYLGVPATDPAFVRIESSLMVAIDGMKKLEAPEKKKGRLFNLRIYESHSEKAGKKKIEMFNQGELEIFRRVGLKPVFFGETIAGGKMPNLTYLLTFENEAGRTAAWDKFRADPEWLKLKAIPEYMDKNIVSKITNKLLVPTAASQL
jgi:hypothetical protein